MAAVTIHSDFGAQENKICNCFHFFPVYLTQNDVAADAAAKSLQSCLTLCDPIDGLLPGSSVPGILQARTLDGLPFPSPMQENEH